MNNGEIQLNKKEGEFIVTRKAITQNGEVIGAFEIFSRITQNNLLVDPKDKDILIRIF